MATIWQCPAAPRELPYYSYDGEHLESQFRSPRPWRRLLKYLRIRRFRKTDVCLLLIDVIIITLLIWTFKPLITLLQRNEELFTPRFNLSQNNTKDASLFADRTKIPRILHQTCANDTIPAKWVDPQASCKKTYSHFEYNLWTDQRARDFISAEYPWFIEIWDNYDFPIQRADSIRYFILYHYGGIYLDMDTYCDENFPLEVIDDIAPHYALFKSTLPTGITNDFMISSARHPAYAATIARLPYFFGISRLFASVLPYCAIMVSSGPLFLSMVIKDYLLERSSLFSQTVQVVHQSTLSPYITDLESASWHQADAKLLMWLGKRPWAWFALGAIGVFIGLLLINHLLLIIYKALTRRIPSSSLYLKLSKPA